MNCKLVHKHGNDYIDGYASSLIVNDVQTHLDSCQECAKYIGAIKRLKTILGDIPVPEKTDGQWKSIHENVLTSLGTNKKDIVLKFTKKVSHLQMFATAAALVLMFVSVSFVYNQFSGKKSSHSQLLYPSLVAMQGDTSKDGNKAELIKVNGVVSTTPGSMSLLKTDSASTIEIAELSKLVIKQYSESNQVYVLEAGSVQIHVNKRKVGQVYVLETPNAVCKVVGTRFTVDVVQSDRGSKTVLTVAEGCVLFKGKNGDSVFVHAGSSRSITGEELDPSEVALSTIKEPESTVEIVVANPPLPVKTKNTKDNSVAVVDEPDVVPAEIPVENSIKVYNERVRESESLFRSGDSEMAFSILQQLIDSLLLPPGLVYEAYMKKARFQKSLKKYSEACQTLEAVVGVNKFKTEHRANALYLLSELKRIELSDGDGAIARYRQYIKEFSNGLMISEAYFTLAELYHAKKEFSEEIRVYKEFVEAYGNLPGIDRAMYSLAQLYTTTQNDCAKAVGLYAHIESKYPNGQFTEDALFWKANCLQNQGKVVLAADAYKDYCVRYPEGRWISEARGRIIDKESVGRR